MAPVQMGIKSGYSLLDDGELFGRIADRIAREHHDIDRERAGKILDQAVLFVAAAGQYPDMGLSPSDAVDIGWDTFILYTQEYFDFCSRFGRYVHHTPNDTPGEETRLPNGERVLTPGETAEVLRRRGYWVLDELWRATTMSGPCYSGTHEGDSESGIKPPR
jgi:hypothetical protein